MPGNPLQQSILRTISYFDLAHFPLTKEELWRFLWTSSAGKAEEFFAVLSGVSFLEEKYGYYFLRGQSADVVERRRAVVPTDQKLEKSRRAARLLRLVPFLRAVFVCNSVGREVAKPESDIDFFIVTETNRLWIARFFANLILRLFGLRTYGKKQRDRVCLSFFVDRAHMDLSPWRVAPDDVHFAYWIVQMIPVYDPEGLYHAFLETNRWLKNFLPNAMISLRATVQSQRRSVWHRFWETLWCGAYGDLIENQAREIQKSLLSRSVKTKAEQKDHGVVIQPGIVKLHENDTRASYRAAWLNKINEAKSYVS
ncbi:MAG: hypothetical protein HY983_02740 [Candidatus Magasanikbacteria bacterium]|nr:hypothetical protein [Candidatus Magasanikbacteria bacterium]